MKIKAFCLILLILCNAVFAQQKPPVTDATTPLHMLKPDYVTPYGAPKPEDVTVVLNRVFGYLEGVTPIGFVNDKTGEAVTDLSKIDANTILKRGDFRIVSYEWGVTYAGMLSAADATGDAKYQNYVEKRLTFIGDSADKFKKTANKYNEWEARMPLRRSVVVPARLHRGVSSRP